jgi:tetratricopeptide (TPR) repeat protein
MGFMMGPSIRAGKRLVKLTRGQSVNERFEIIEELGDWEDRARYRVKDLKSGLTALLEHRLQAVRTVEPSRSFWPSPLDCATLIQIESTLLRRLYGYGYLDARPYLVLEELQGPSLEDWLKDAKPDPEYWMPVVLAALSGLAMLHDQGLVHGQWQPSSLTLTKRGAVIHDFGAFVSEFECFDRPAELSSPYSAPELGSIQPIDRRADLYAIGVLLVRLLTGRLPFEGTAEQVQRLQLRGLSGRQIELPDQQRFAPLIESLLHRQPSERPRDARTVAMQLHELTGLAAELPERAPQSILVPEFVGRRRELAVLNAAASFMIDGAEIEGVDEGPIEGPGEVHRRSTRLVRMRHESDRMPLAPTSWVQIYGHPGLGKRRFVAEFSYRLMAHGIDLICLSGQSLRGETFDPITLILERLLSRPGAKARLEEASESVCRALLRFMPDRYSEIPTPASQVDDEEDLLSPEEGLGLRSRLLDGLTSFILREAQARPITLIITDFELLPDLARELIAHLSRRVATSRRWQGRLSARSRSNPSDGAIPLFVVSTSELQDTTRSAGSDGSYTLEISKLKDGDIERMLASAAGASSIDPPLLSAILESAQGSPRRTIEILHRLQSAGPLQIRGGSLCAPTSAILPELLDGAALLASIRNESPLVLEILFVFARLQRPVPSPLLFDLFDAHEVLDALHGMIKAQLIRRGPQGLLLLRDARLGALAVEELDKEVAAGLDKRIQESLELAYLQIRSDDRLVELAEHALLAGLPERSIEYVIEAAGRFERIRADDRAARLYEGVISKRPELELRVRLAGSYFRCDRSVEAIKELREVAQGAGDSWPLVPRVIVQRRLAFMLRAAERLDEALEAFVAGERLLEESPADFESAREHAALLCEKSEMLLGAGARLETVARIAERAQAVLREHAGAAHGRDVSLVRARLLGLQGQLELLRDRLDGAEHLMRGALAMQERHGAVLEAARSLYRLGNLELSRGRDDRAEKLWERSLKLREEAGDREGAALILSNLSLAAARLGQLEKARELTFKSLRIREEAGDLYGRASSLHNLGFIYQAGGKLEEAVSAYNECLALRETLDDPLYAARAQTNLGHTLFLLGETIEARDRMSAGLATARELNDPEGEAAALVRLAEIDFFRGRFERAQRRIAQSWDLRQSFGGPEESVDTAQVEAVIDMGLGRVSVALERMEKAITLARSHRLQLQLARALLNLGRMLIQVRDFDRAKGCLVEAQQLYLQFGDLRSLRITLMELATVYVAVGLHSDAYAVSGPPASGARAQRKWPRRAARSRHRPSSRASYPRPPRAGQPRRRPEARQKAGAGGRGALPVGASDNSALACAATRQRGLRGAGRHGRGPGLCGRSPRDRRGAGRRTA